ncbi:MAG: DNA polymerase III subunit delta' [Pseudomonadales bacterium]
MAKSEVVQENRGLSSRLPWQFAPWQKLTELHGEDRLPHALLLVGHSGVGAENFALAFAEYLLCAAPSAGGACGECSGCALNEAGSHPDLKILSPEKPGGQIKIDSVRAVIQFGHETAQQGGYRVIIVKPAEAMNHFAANSLLKLLEEPGHKTVILLQTAVPGALLATIRSRCQWVRLPPPPIEDARSWLAALLAPSAPIDALLDAANGMPLLALDMHESGTADVQRQIKQGLESLILGRADPLALASQWQSHGVVAVLDVVYFWLVDVLGSLYGGQGKLDPKFQSWLAARVLRSQLFGLQQNVVSLRRRLLSGNNPNGQLLLESLLSDLRACVSR